MYYLHKIVLYAHILVGAAALVIFWLPMAFKKGSKQHIKIGKLYNYSMYFISYCAIIACILTLIDPIAARYPEMSLDSDKAQRVIQFSRQMGLFLLMLSVLILVSVKHGNLVLKAKKDRTQLKTKTHLTLLFILIALSIAVLIMGAQTQQLLYLIFAGIGLSVSYGMIRYIFRKQIKEREWIHEHLGAMLGSGIGLYTAFFAVGGRHLFADILQGQMQVIMWVLPGVIGTLLSISLGKKYRQKFRIQ